MRFRPSGPWRRRLAVLLLPLWLGACGEADGQAPPAAETPVPGSPEAVRPLAPGSAVPSAAVRDVAGARVDLASLVAEQGALLVFYRGGW